MGQNVAMTIKDLRIAIFALGCAAALYSQSGKPTDIDGDWVAAITFFDNTEYRRMTLHRQGDDLTGTAGDLKLHGAIHQGKVEFEGTNEKGATAHFSGTVDHGEMSGNAKWRGDDVKWKAMRPVARPADAPRNHVFEPKEFHRMFSGAIPPVLHIFPGDSVKTWSVDAGGSDSKGVRRSLGGNPDTGPFYVEGALPGDTLVIHFTRIRLNRDTAISSGSIAGTALNPYYLANLKKVEKYDSDWRLDREKGVAMLAHPTDKLKNYSVPLRPM